jgi:hypothetical protein
VDESFSKHKEQNLSWIWGGVDEVSYWVDLSLGQGVFAKRPLSNPCEGYEVVMDQDSLGMGFMTYNGL